MDASYPCPLESVAAFEKVFHPLDAIARELDGSISPPTLGIRKINKRRLNMLSEKYGEGEDLALGISGPTLEHEVTIPDVLFSQEDVRVLRVRSSCCCAALESF